MEENFISRTSINMMQNQLKNASMHKLEEEPINPVQGQFYFNILDRKPYFFDGNNWVCIEDKNFRYTQDTPSEIWTINHTLNKITSVTVTDSAGTIVYGRVVINNENTVIIEFNAPFSGYADLN